MKTSRQFLTFLALGTSTVLLAIFLAFQRPIPSQPGPEAPTKKPTPNLYFSKPEIDGENLIASLILKPETEKVAAVDIAVSFNPEILTFVEFEPGDLFENPIILKREVNQEQGKLRFALATKNPAQQQGFLANLTFALKAGVEGPIEIKIVKEKSQVSAIGKKGNVLGESTNLLYYPSFP